MKIFKKILKWLGISIGVFLFLILVAAVFTQTSFFKNRLRVLLVSTISTNINGSLHLGNIDGNFLGGFSIDSVAIDDESGTVISTGKIDCKYHLLSILENKIKITKIAIEKPAINFFRPAEGNWNFGKLIKPKEDTTKSKLNWTIQIDTVVINNGMISLLDSVSLVAADHWDMPSSYFEYHNFTIRNLKFELSAVIKDNRYESTVRKLSCYSPESDFELKNFKGNFLLSDKKVEAKNVRIETGKSNFGFSASMKDINLFENLDLKDIEHDSTKLEFHSVVFSLAELRSFLPQVNFLDGETITDVIAEGEFGNLNLPVVHLKTLQSEISLSGKIKNLHDPANLFIDVISNNSKINPPDVPLLLPGLPIPEFGNIQPLSVYLTYTGLPTNFRTQIKLESPSNSVTVDGKMNLNISPPAYDFSYLVKNIDIGKLFRIENFPTALYSSGNIKGEGFKVEDLSASLQASIDSSVIKGIPVDNAQLDLVGSTRHIEGKLISSFANSKAHIQGTIDFPPKGLSEYDGTIEVSSFNIATITGDSNYHSDLNFKGTISGKGTEIDNLNCDVAVSLLPSSFRNHDLNAEELSFSLDQTDLLNRHLRIESQIADVDVKGDFRLSKNIQDAASQISNLINSIEKHVSVDSVRAIRIKQNKNEKINSIGSQMNLTYNVTLKNLEPVSTLLSETPFDANAKVKGTMRSDGRYFSMSSDAEINEFFIGTTKGGILLHHSTFESKLDSLNKNNTLESLTGSFYLSIDSGRLNTKKIKNTRINFDYKNLKSTVNGRSNIDSIIGIQLSGLVSVQPQTFAIDLDSMIVSLGTYSWKNRQDVQLRFNTDGIRVMHAEFLGENERISVKGNITTDEKMNLGISLREFDLSMLGIFSNDPSLRKPGKGFTGILSSGLNLTGTISKPVIQLTATARDITFRKSTFGVLSARMDYENENANVNLSLRKNPAVKEPDFELSGNLPCNLSFNSVEERFPHKPQHLRLTADKFDISLIDPLLNDFDEMSGKIQCDLILEGTPQQPEYKGTISFNETRFLFNPNNIRYILNSNLEAKNDKIWIKEFSVTNVKDKGYIGTSDATGYFSLTNFKVDYFDFLVKGQILLMTDGTRKVSPNIYGLLFTETDSSGIILKGNLERPYLSGKLFVREANLTFPPTKDQEIANQNLTLRYKLIDDTSKIAVTPTKISRYYTATDSFDLELSKSSDSPILDRLRYNINVETRGPTALTMIFTPATGEELYAELDGKASVINEQGTPTVYGEIDVSPRSYYNFFKHFSANGKLKFVGPWNNPEFDIKAAYEGYKQRTQQTGELQPSVPPVAGSSTQTSDQKIIVILKITGTRMEPQLNMSMQIQDKPGENPIDFSSQTKGGDVQSNALAFIITGKFRDELTSRDQQEFTSLGAGTGTSVASNLLSSILSEVLKREFPFIRRADVSYRGGSVQEGTSINVTATVGKGSLSIGGTILQDIGNTNVSYQLNVGDLLNISSIRNLFIEIQRKVEGDNPESKILTNEARIFYRFSF
ncbi:MAG: AsmA family protein [Ignavibacteriales bacterium]|nr:AsmA family protein [Ignavibacteriales bacterium]